MEVVHQYGSGSLHYRLQRIRTVLTVDVAHPFHQHQCGEITVIHTTGIIHVPLVSLNGFRCLLERYRQYRRDPLRYQVQTVRTVMLYSQVLDVPDQRYRRDPGIVLVTRDPEEPPDLVVRYLYRISDVVEHGGHPPDVQELLVRVRERGILPAPSEGFPQRRGFGVYGDAQQEHVDRVHVMVPLTVHHLVRTFLVRVHQFHQTQQVRLAGEAVGIPERAIDHGCVLLGLG